MTEKPEKKTSAKELAERIETLTEEKKKLEVQLKELIEAGAAKDGAIRELNGKIEEHKGLISRMSLRLQENEAVLRDINQPTKDYAYFYRHCEDGSFDVRYNNRYRNVSAAMMEQAGEIDLRQVFQTGIKIKVVDANNNLIIMGPAETPWEETGEESVVVGFLDNGLLRVQNRLDQTRDVIPAAPLENENLKEGDIVKVYDIFAIQKLPKTKEVEDLFLTEIPDVSYEDIGGLDEEIRIIRYKLEYPFLYPEIFKKYPKLKLPKGILLHGPPGCGKTMLAKAVARQLEEQCKKILGEDAHSRFINIKGPELLDKWVGNTERKIRDVFSRAGEMASEKTVVVVFFDEMDSFLPARGSGISSDVEKTNVAQFCAELDGLKPISNVVVIGATNRQELIDQAVLRPGRFNIKIEIKRPDTREKAEKILRKKITLPYLFHKQYAEKGMSDEETHEHIIQRALESMFSTEEIRYKDQDGNEKTRHNKFVQLTYHDGSWEILYYFRFVSGAMIDSVCNRAWEKAAIAEIETGEEGMRARYVCAAVQEEYEENEDLPNTNDPTEWAKIMRLDKKGKKVVNVTFLNKDAAERKIETTDVKSHRL